MSDAALLSDADVGLGAPAVSAAPQGVLSDEDIGLGGSAKGAAPAAPDVKTENRPYLDTLVRQSANAIPGMTHIAALGDTAVSYLPQSVKSYIPGVNPADQSGESFSQRYSENLAGERAVDAADAAQYPITSVVAPLAASVAALPMAGPIDAVSSGIAGVAPRLGGLAADSLASGVVGAGYGAAYGAGAADTPSQILPNMETGATLGGIGGAAIPAVAKGISSLGSAGAKLAKGVFDPTGTGADLAAETIARDQATGLGTKMDPQQFADAQAAGQPVVAGDLGGEATMKTARAVGNVSPSAKAVMQDPLAARFASQNTRLPDFIDGLYGGNVDAEAMKVKMAQQAKNLNDPAYNQARADAAALPNGMWNPGEQVVDKNGAAVPNLQELLNAPPMQSAIKDATQKGATDAVLKGNQIVKNPFAPDANGNLALRTNPDGSVAQPGMDFWHVVKGNLDDQIGSALSSNKKYEAGQLIGLQKALLANMDSMVPSYGVAREGAFHAFGADNALDAGAGILKPSVTPFQVQQVAATIKTPLQRQAFDYGAVSAVASKAMNAGDGRDVVKLFDTPAIRQKLQTAIAPDRFTQLEAYLRTEASMNIFKNAIGGNSTTAEQLHGLGKMVAGQLASPIAGGIEGAVLGYHQAGGFDPEEMLKYGAAGAMGGMLTKAYRGNNAKMMQSFAENLASRDPAVANAAIARIAKNKQMMESLRRVSSHLAALPATGARQFGSTQQEYAPAQ